ncbi:hypothetical protein FOA52_004363 [Chlamydomonas sp. UWO 241]|nr:hypothetical protein FOA52_004363 [Chlamydomonas sp. UWO 241]
MDWTLGQGDPMGDPMDDSGYYDTASACKVEESGAGGAGSNLELASNASHGFLALLKAEVEDDQPLQALEPEAMEVEVEQQEQCSVQCAEVPGTSAHQHRSSSGKTAAGSKKGAAAAAAGAGAGDPVPGILSDGPRGKQCSKCKDVKALDCFCKDPTKKIGYQSWCKACYREHNERRAQALAAPEHRKPVSHGLCTICKSTKPSADFIKDSRRPTGLDARCKECRRKCSSLARTGLNEWPCVQCGDVKPASEYKLSAATGCGPDADSSCCKSCSELRRKDAAGQSLTEPTVPGKQCLRCGLTKPSVDFTRDSRKKSGMGPRCKACEAEYCREKRHLMRLKMASANGGIGVGFGIGFGIGGVVVGSGGVGAGICGSGGADEEECGIPGVARATARSASTRVRRHTAGAVRGFSPDTHAGSQGTAYRQDTHTSADGVQSSPNRGPGGRQPHSGGGGTLAVGPPSALSGRSLSEVGVGGLSLVRGGSGGSASRARSPDGPAAARSSKRGPRHGTCGSWGSERDAAAALGGSSTASHHALPAHVRPLGGLLDSLSLPLAHHRMHNHGGVGGGGQVDSVLCAVPHPWAGVSQGGAVNLSGLGLRCNATGTGSAGQHHGLTGGVNGVNGGVGGLSFAEADFSLDSFDFAAAAAAASLGLDERDITENSARKT